VEKIQKPYFASQTVMRPFGLERRHPGRPPKVAPLRAAAAAVDVDNDVARDRVKPLGGLHPLKPLIREWLLELKVMGRSREPSSGMSRSWTGTSAPMAS
jgi:hypothetical protein